MEIIRQWTSIFLNGIIDSSGPNLTNNSKQIKKCSVAFGRTTHEQSKKMLNRYIYKHGDRERKLASFLQRGGTTKRFSRDEKKQEPFDFQQGKIHGRQIMNRNHDPKKAQQVRQRQKQYSIQVLQSSTRRNSASSLNMDSITRVVVQGFKNLIGKKQWPVLAYYLFHYISILDLRFPPDCERCALFLMDHKTNELYFKPLGGHELQHDVECEEIRFPANSGVAGYCANARVTLNIKNAYQDPRFNPEIDKQTHFRTRTILCMPVLSSTGTTVLGVIQMINKKKGDVKKIFSDAKKKKSDSHFHGYDSGYEEFSQGDEEILKNCCEEVSKVLEPLLLKTMAPSASETPNRPKDETASERRLSSVSRRDSRRVSIGSLVQFVNSKSESNTPSWNQEKPIGEVDISVTEAFSRFQFRTVSGTPAKGADDPERAVAASRRKRMIDYGNMRRKSVSACSDAI